MEPQQISQLYGNYLPVLIATIIGFVLVISALVGSRLLAPFSQEREKGTTYECGMLPIKRASTNVGMRFYLYALLFIIFDVEAVFIFPWAVKLDRGPDSLGAFGLIEMAVFIVILTLGLVYAWRKGVLRWA